MSSEVVQRSASAVAALEAVNAELTRRMEAIPDAPDDGGASMFWALLNATHWNQLDDPWSGQGLAKFIGLKIAITDVHKMPSDFEGGPSWYLVATGAVEASGEQVTITTSSAATMIQIIIAYTNGWLPLIVIPRVATKPTKSGFYPQHLEIISGPRLAPVGADA